MSPSRAPYDVLLLDVLARRFPDLDEATRHRVVADATRRLDILATPPSLAALTQTALLRAAIADEGLPVRAVEPLDWDAEGVEATLRLADRPEAPILVAPEPPRERSRLDRRLATGVTLVGAVLIAAELLSVAARDDGEPTAVRPVGAAVVGAAGAARGSQPADADASRRDLRRVRTALRRPLAARPTATAAAQPTVAPAATATAVPTATASSPTATAAPVTTAPPAAPVATAPPAAPAATAAPTTAPPKPVQSFDDSG